MKLHELLLKMQCGDRIEIIDTVHSKSTGSKTVRTYSTTDLLENVDIYTQMHEVLMFKAQGMNHLVIHTYAETE